MTTTDFYQNTILENIDFDGYNLSSDVSIYDKVQTLYNIFKSEYVHKNNQHINEKKLFADWLSGLPSSCTVPFYYYEILKNGRNAGFDLTTEKLEDDFCASYFLKLSEAFFNLKNQLTNYKNQLI